MSRTVLRALIRTSLVLATAGMINAGCSRQAEGERCDLEWAGPTQDCDSGLVCVACGYLVDAQADRCCPQDGTYSDPLCRPASNPNGTTCSTHKITGIAGMGATVATGGTGGTGGAGGTAGAGNTGGLGAAGGTGGSGAASGAGGTAGTTTDMSAAGDSNAGAGG